MNLALNFIHQFVIELDGWRSSSCFHVFFGFNVKVWVGANNNRFALTSPA